MTPADSGAAGRTTGKRALQERAARLRREADQLDALANALPEWMTVDADAALWQLAIGGRSNPCSGGWSCERTS